MPGSVGGPIRERLEAVSGKRVGVDIGLCYNPEFIALGDVVKGLLKPDFILIGESDPRAGELLSSLYHRVVGPTVPISRMSFVNAELTKISVNTYVTMKISFANMLVEICDHLEGADVSIVADAVGRDTRVGKKYLRPAVGYGGPCFPRDTVAFSQVAHLVGSTADLALSTDTINRRQVTRLTEMVSELIPPGKTVAILGMSYKPSTPVIEESQGVMLAKSLKDTGFAVVAHDPMARAAANAVLGDTVQFFSTTRETILHADAAVIVTPWPEYSEISPDWIQNGRIRIIIDCWRQLVPESFIDRCQVVRLGHQETIAAAAKRQAAE
jgi:UDPglucose 6-dehydrogenase